MSSCVGHQPGLNCDELAVARQWGLSAQVHRSPIQEAYVQNEQRMRKFNAQ